MTSDGDRLESGALLEHARRATGLDDFGDATLIDRVAAVVETVLAADLDPAGTRAAAETIDGLLTSRLRFFDDHQSYRLAQERVERPVFATGEPRSGTTLLHALLAVDPGARALRFWEVMYPSPPPGLARRDDPRRALADADWREISERIPSWIVSHPYNDMLGDGLPECERTWAFDFRAMTPSTWWRVPIAMRPALPQDPVAQYRIHQMMLQHVQHTRPERHWVLKGFHGQRLDALFSRYPDACMIWVHREPVQMIASQVAAFGRINEALAGPIEWAAYAESTAIAARDRLLEVCNDPMVDDDRIQHVPYRDFVDAPVETLHSFYDRFGVSFTSATERAMNEYLATSRPDRYGKFEYSTDVLGPALDWLDESLGPYRERFGLSQ